MDMSPDRSEDGSEYDEEEEAGGDDDVRNTSL